MNIKFPFTNMVHMDSLSFLSGSQRDECGQSGAGGVVTEGSDRR
jgi:hypothetical protein